MKIKTIVCKTCGHEERLEIGPPEEILRMNKTPTNPRCKKCGSRNIELHD